MVPRLILFVALVGCGAPRPAPPKGDVCNAGESCMRSPRFRGIDVVVGERISCVDRGDGAVLCFGRGREGDERVSSFVVRGPRPIDRIVLAPEGGVHCTIDSDSELRCADFDRPNVEPRRLAGVSAVALGGHVGCAVRSGALACFALSPGAPIVPIGGVDRAEIVGVGERAVCVLREGAVVCAPIRIEQGEPAARLEGGPSKTAAPPPSIPVVGRFQPIVGLARARDLVVRGERGCALLEDARLSCWSLSTGAREQSRDQIAAVALANDRLCVIRTGGGAECDAPKDRDDPRPGGSIDLRATEGARRIALGERHACVVGQNDHVACWGDGEGGALGVSVPPIATAYAPIAAAAGITRFAKVVAGDAHACAQTEGGLVACWGASFSASPRIVEELRDVVELAAGGGATCTLDGKGAIRCLERGVLRTIATGVAARAIAVTRRRVCFLDGARVRCVAFEGDGEDPFVAITDAVEIFAAVDTICALRKSGAIACAWSLDRQARDTGLSIDEPTANDRLRRVGLGQREICAVRAGRLACAERAAPARDRGPAAAMICGRTCFAVDAQGIAPELRMRHGDELGAPRSAAVGVEFDCFVGRSGVTSCAGRQEVGQTGRGIAVIHREPVIVPLVVRSE
jgi:hypothetical protein